MSAKNRIQFELTDAAVEVLANAGLRREVQQADLQAQQGEAILRAVGPWLTLWLQRRGRVDPAGKAAQDELRDALAAEKFVAEAEAAAGSTNPMIIARCLLARLGITPAEALLVLQALIDEDAKASIKE